MEFLPKETFEKLLSNGKEQEKVRGTDNEKDFYPVVKLFLPETACTWLLTEIDPEYEQIAFGLCDLGLGFPELGSVSLYELASLKSPILNLPIEIDKHFKATKSLSEYADEARDNGQILAYFCVCSTRL